MAEAIAGIKATVAATDLEGFTRSWQMQRAVERALEIVSEASRAVPEKVKADYSFVPWAQIAGIGNILRHEYHRVEPLIIWNITQSHIRLLDDAIKMILNDAP